MAAVALRVAASAVAASVAAASVGTVQAPVEAVQVDPKTGFLVDTSGRVRIFHGVNVVYKDWPWLPPTDRFDPSDSLTDGDMDLLRAWGFNVVRLGVMWPGVEPAPGVISDGYLKQATELASRLADCGIYTLVDFHQDLLSRHFCGEGLPEHYVDAMLADPNSRLSKSAPFPRPASKPMALNSSGYPDIKDCLSGNFGLYYPSHRVGALFHELYTPGTALNDGMLRYWRAVAGAFAGQPYLLGYELLNEPSGFCMDESLASCLDLDPFLNSRFEEEHLVPFYRQVAAAIRTADQRAPLWYEPSPLPKLDGHDPFVAPALNDTQQGLAYHIYCLPGDDQGQTAEASCSIEQDLGVHNNMGFQRRFPGVAGFMTEFGAISNRKGQLDHMVRLMGLADEHFQNWAYWQLKFFKDITTQDAAEPLYDQDGVLEVDKLRALSRTYAQAIAGVPTKMSFDMASGDFELDFNLTNAKGPTVIYLNKDLHYPTGYQVEVDPQGCLVVVEAGDHHLQISESSTNDFACAQQSRQVRIRRAGSRTVASFI